MKLVVLSSVVAVASAFAPTSLVAVSRTTSSRQSTPEPVEAVEGGDTVNGMCIPLDTLFGCFEI